MGTMKKKKKKARPPKGMLKRAQRLQRAKAWLPTVAFTGKRLVHAYAKKYHTDLLVSVTELRMMGIAITTEYEAALKSSIADRLAQKQQQQQAKQDELNGLLDDQDGDFAFIAGYTSGGMPYGVRWNEMPVADDL